MTRPATQLVASLSDKFDFSAFDADHPEDNISCVTSMPKLSLQKPEGKYVNKTGIISSIVMP